MTKNRELRRPGNGRKEERSAGRIPEDKEEASHWDRGKDKYLILLF